MKFRKTVSAVLAAALAASSVSICAFAEEDQAMKTEMTYVKQRLDIPSELSKFTYRTGTDNNKTRYTFTWQIPDEKIDYTEKDKLISVSVSITGKVIKSVNVSKTYNDDSWKPSFAKLSDSELIKAAKEYINSINPSIKGNTKIDEDSLTISLYGEEAGLRFYREVNGVRVTNQNGYITINKNTGELIRYNYNWTNGAGFSDTKDAISLSDAKAAYQKLFDSDLVYTLEYDWESKKYTPHLIYKQNTSGQINAFTGKLSTFEDYGDYESYDDDMPDEEAMATADNGVRAKGEYGEVTFTAAEIEKLEKENSLIKAEDALKELKKYDFLLIPDSCDITWQSCSFNETEGYYVRNVQFTAKQKDYYDLSSPEYKVLVENGYEDHTVSGSFTINAETGELLSFRNFSYDNNTSLSEKKANETAEKAAKALLGNTYSTFGKTESNKSTRYTEYDPKTGRGIGNPITTSVSYSANREANGIRCINESYSLTVGNNGYVSNFRVTQHKDVTYPKPEKIITKDAAYKNFFKNVEFGLRYRCAYRTEDKKVVTALVYAADSTLCIDAFTGKCVNSDGSEIYVDEAGDYTDLATSKYKAYAEKLASYGIKLMDKEGKLNENAVITAGDFLALLQSIGLSTDIKNDLGLTEETKVSRKTAAMMIVAANYGTGVAEMTSIFKNKFSDVNDTSKYLGYIMIADNAGWIKGNSKGKFNPDSAFTRGKAIKLAYDYLSKVNK